VLGPDSIDVATSFNNIGSVYWSKGDYDRALENYNKSLAIQTKVLGPESIDVAKTSSIIKLY
jgi:tetratricopeptide (TPR) repeat protein